MLLLPINANRCGKACPAAVFALVSIGAADGIPAWRGAAMSNASTAECLADSRAFSPLCRDRANAPTTHLAARQKGTRSELGL